MIVLIVREKQNLTTESLCINVALIFIEVNWMKN